MGLFELIFQGGRQRIFQERVWLTSARRDDDVVARVKAHKAKENCPVVVAHFSSTRERVVKALAKAGIKPHLLAPPEPFPSDIRDEWRSGGTVLVLSSEMIPFDRKAAPRPCAKDAAKPPVTVHLVEHYPTPSRDQRVLHLDTVWPMNMDFICYTSLDEPLMVRAGAERVKEIANKAGLTDKVPLSHHMLSQSIRLAQRKLAKQVKEEQPCDSAEEWFRKNLPGKQQKA